MSIALEETTVAKLHAAIEAGETTAHAITAGYLARIEAYDRSGPTINSIVTVNTAAEAQAAELDRRFAADGSLTGPLHGIPIVVKDQAETAGIETTFGSIAFDGYIPEHDATVIARLREAGAIILAKTAMPDFATSWFGYSSKAGITKNPYDIEHDPGGSSGGTGAAVSANFGTLGIGEDTGGSIRLPASFDNLVGLKVTPGLVSRTGMSPLVVFQDSAGPMCRTVEDAARLLNVIAGYDAKDPFTATAAIVGEVDYLSALDPNALDGEVIAVLRAAFGDPNDPLCAAVNDRIEQALSTMRELGAKTVDIAIPDLDHDVEYTSLYVTHSRHDIDSFLKARPALAQHNLKDIIDAGQYHPAIELLPMLAAGPEDPHSDPEYFQRYTAREMFQRKIINAIASNGATAMVFPTTQIPSPSRVDLDAGKWETFTFPTNTLIAAQSWLPAVSVPAGFTDAGLPVGLEIVGMPYGEARLLSFAYAYEQASGHRRAPASTPEL